MKQVLLIGGIGDGTRLNVADKMHEIRVPEMPEAEVIAACADTPSTIPVLRESLYFIHEYRNAAGSRFIATEDRIPDLNKIMMALFDGYRVEDKPNVEW